MIRSQYQYNPELHKEVEELYRKYQSYARVGRIVGRSRQRVHQIIQRGVQNRLNEEKPQKFRDYNIKTTKTKSARSPELRAKYPTLKDRGIPETIDSTRKIIMERDGFCCYMCKYNGKWRDNILVVHHIDHSGLRQKKDDSPENLITLCNMCHASYHSKKGTNLQRKLRSRFATYSKNKRLKIEAGKLYTVK